MRTSLFQNLPYIYQLLDTQEHLEKFLQSFEDHLDELDEFGDDLHKIAEPYLCPPRFLPFWVRTLNIPVYPFNPETMSNGNFNFGVPGTTPDDWYSGGGDSEFYLENQKGTFVNLGSGTHRVRQATDAGTAEQYDRFILEFDYYDVEDINYSVQERTASDSYLAYALTAVELSGTGHVKVIFQVTNVIVSRLRLGFTAVVVGDNTGAIDNVTLKQIYSPEEYRARKMIAKANYIKRTMRNTADALEQFLQLLVDWDMDISQNYTQQRYGVIGNRHCVSIDPSNTEMMDAIGTADDYVCRFFDSSAEPNIVYVEVEVPTSPADPQESEKKALIELWAPKFCPATVKCIVTYDDIDMLLMEDGDQLLFEDGTEIQLDQ